MPITGHSGRVDRGRFTMSSQALVEQLAERHDAHLRWLRARLSGRLADDEFEDILQAAYARALTSLSAPVGKRPHFAELEQAVAWLRTVALNLAHDVARERHGRPGPGRAPRPASIALDEYAAGQLVADVDVEDEVLESVDRADHRSLVLEAIAGLDPRHRQILQLRYGQDLGPAAVMVLVGLDRRQWDGRHTRALKAFGRALARLQVSRDCGRTRSLLRQTPASLLKPEGEAGDHIASCVACAAFSAAARFAMVALPLPVTIEPWRLDALDVLSRPSSSARPAPDGATIAAVDATTTAGGAATPTTGLAATAGALAAAGALAVAGALALAGLAADGHGRQPPERAEPKATTHKPDVGTTQTGTRLAVHHTSRQALERGAREMARRRSEAAAQPSSGPPAPRPSSGAAASAAP